MKTDKLIGWEKISPSNGHYFFGYYDRIPWNSDNTLHLALKVSQCERLPVPGESAEVGVIDMSSNKFESCASTRAWCHQQGAMTQWLKHRPDCFIYNDWDEKEKKLLARVYSLKNGVVDSFPFPIYALSPDGRWGASLNFNRIPRRGYSYADATLDTSSPQLDNDGIFVIDMLSKEAILAVTYGQMFERHPASFLTENQHSWVNHIIFNCDSSKFMFLMRHCNDPQKPYPWQTHMYTCDLNGSNLVCPLPDFYWKSISHQIWGRTPDEILIDADWRGQGSEYVVFYERVRPLQAELISSGMGPMGHLIFSPDGKKMLADTYSVNGFQTMALVDVASGKFKRIGRFKHCQSEKTPDDVRCDLHPRWNDNGSLISVDSIHDGKRGIYCYQME